MSKNIYANVEITIESEFLPIVDIVHSKAEMNTIKVYTKSPFVVSVKVLELVTKPKSEINENYKLINKETN